MNHFEQGFSPTETPFKQQPIFEPRPDLNEIPVITGDDPRSALEILRSGETLKQVSIEVPVEKVILDEAIVDDGRVASLQESMKGRLGQHSPTIYRASDIDGDVVYEVIDGYHRTSGRRALGLPTVNANVYYNITDEELLDARIEATTVKQVQWSRIAEWVANSWAQTPWAQKGLTATQAFSLISRDASRSYIVAQEDIEAVKQWALDKCRKWDRKPQYIHSILKISDAADPELIRTVRTSKAGRGKIDVLTPARLAGIVDVFPGTEFYDVQKELAKISTEEHLSANETRDLTYRLADLSKEEMSQEEIVEILRTNRDSLLESIRNQHSNLGDDNTEDEDEALAEESGGYNFARELSQKSPSILLRDVSTTLSRSSEQPTNNISPRRETSEYIEDNYANPNPKKKTRQDSTRWWVTNRQLSEQEKEVMKRLFTDEISPSDLQRQTGLSAAEIISLIATALQKRDERN